MSQSKLNVNFNGKILPAQTPIFSAQNRAFNYGDGLFETMRVIKGHIPFLDYHFNRISHGLNVLQINTPKSFTRTFFKSEILRLCGKRKKARARFSVFRSDGGLYTPQSDQLNFLITEHKLQQDTYTSLTEGLSITLYNGISLTYNTLSPLKTINALPYVLAARQKKLLEVDDVLLLNNYGRVAEASSSNIVIWDGERFKTPSIEEACVGGIVRTVLLEEARKYDVIFEEASLDVQEIKEAKAVFLTNCIQGVKRVRFFDKKSYDKRTSKRVGKVLLGILNSEAVLGA